MKFQAAGILLFTLLAAGCSAQSPSCGDPETLAKLKEAVVKAVGEEPGRRLSRLSSRKPRMGVRRMSAGRRSAGNSPLKPPKS